MIDRKKLSSHLYQEEDEILAGHIFDKIEIVLKRKNNESTNFLNPYECEIASGIIKQIYDVNFNVDGGYQGAERKRITIFPEYLFPDHVESPLSLLKISGNFKFQAISHRDFLGALMGLGIKREMVGDIVLTDDFGQVVVADEIKEFIILNLNNVHEVPVVIKEILAENIIIPPDQKKEIKTTVASMRLDAVASAGFGDSRSKISREIENQKVKVNYKLKTNPSENIDIGDLISIHGRGRVKVDKNIGQSHRGRIKLILQRYI